jgi:hypothetical protein
VIGPLDDVVGRLALRYAAGQVPHEVLAAAWPGEPRLLERLLGGRSTATGKWDSAGPLPLHPITRRMLGVDLDGSRRIEAAHVGCLVGPDRSRRIQKDWSG